jgi:hypothetical protein
MCPSDVLPSSNAEMGFPLARVIVDEVALAVGHSISATHTHRTRDLVTPSQTSLNTDGDGPWIRRPRLGDNPAEHFLEQGRVGLSPGLDFGAPARGFARLNLGTSRSLIEEAVNRMAKVAG